MGAMRAAHHVARVSCLAAVIAASSYPVARGSIEVPRRMTPPKPNSVQRSKPSGECGQDRGIVGEGAWDDGLLARSSSGGTGGLGSVVQEVIADRGRGGGGGVGVAPTDAISSAHHKVLLGLHVQQVLFVFVPLLGILGDLESIV